MTEPRNLIVNADDLGLSHGVNRGIFRAHTDGIVTSASLMVRYPAAAEAAAIAQAHPRLSLGLHIDLGEWALRDGEWAPLYEVVDADDAQAIQAEIATQLDTFRHLTGRAPTHLDSHQHVHRRDPIRSIAMDIATQLNVSLREIRSPARYCGAFYGQDYDCTPLPHAITADALLKVLRELPPGATELACHPGYVDELTSVYRREREQELTALCDPRVRTALGELGIRLCRFEDIQP